MTFDAATALMTAWVSSFDDVQVSTPRSLPAGAGKRPLPVPSAVFLGSKSVTPMVFAAGCLSC